MDRTLKPRAEHDWAFLLSPSQSYEKEIHTLSGTYKRSFDLWKQLAEMTSESLKQPETVNPSSEGFKKKAAPRVSAPLQKVRVQNIEKPTLQQQVASRVQREKEMLKILLDARRNGAEATKFKRKPGTFSSIIKKTKPHDPE